MSARVGPNVAIVRKRAASAALAGAAAIATIAARCGADISFCDRSPLPAKAEPKRKLRTQAIATRARLAEKNFGGFKTGTPRECAELHGDCPCNYEGASITFDSRCAKCTPAMFRGGKILVKEPSGQVKC